VSLVQLLVVLGGAALVLSGVVRTRDSWMPLGVLAAANAASLVVGMLWVAPDDSTREARLEGDGASLLRSGGWLLVMGMLPHGAAVLAGLFLAQVRGPGALGYLEAARIVAQPILVFATGLNAVLGPRSMHAARAADAAPARRLSRRFVGAVLIVGIAYAGMFGAPHAWNLFTHLTPKAFEIPWVVMLMIVAHIALSLSLPERSELLGAERSRSLASIEAVASLATVLCALLAIIIGILALPLGLIVQAIVRHALMRVHAMRLYGGVAARSTLDGR
jgi:O-antigen/teichoic acid export membrane protein